MLHKNDTRGGKKISSFSFWAAKLCLQIPADYQMFLDYLKAVGVNKREIERGQMLIGREAEVNTSLIMDVDREETHELE